MLGQLPGPNPTIAPDAFWAEVREGLRVAVAGLSNPIEHDAIQLWLGRLTHQPRLHRRYWERRVQPRRARAINSLRSAAAQGHIADAKDADLLVDMLAGLLLYRLWVILCGVGASTTAEGEPFTACHMRARSRPAPLGVVRCRKRQQDVAPWRAGP